MSDNAALDTLKHGAAGVPVEEIFLKRWSPRAFAAKAVPEAALHSIFTAAAWAASSYNEQPWRFLVGRKGDATWQKIFDSLMPLNQAWAANVPVLYASFAKKTFSHNGSPNGVAAHDVGAASAQACLQASLLGLYTHGMAGFDRARLHADVAAPEDFEAVACWALGYLGDPNDLPEAYREIEGQPRQRKPLPEFVFGAWGQPAL